MRKRSITLAVLLPFTLWAAWALAQFTPVPALPDLERRTAYSVATTTGPFSVNFALYGDGTDYGNWVGVYLNGILQNPATYTLTSPSGPLGSIQLPIVNGVITFATPITGTLEIVGAQRPRRLSQLSENRGVSAHDFNVIITNLVADLREHWDTITQRVVQVPPGETQALLPSAASRANQNAVFDAAGNLTAGLPAPGSVTISAAMQPVVGAATLPLARTAMGIVDLPIGMEVDWPGLVAPSKWLLEGGQTVLRATFPELLAAIAPTFGATVVNGNWIITGISSTTGWAPGWPIECACLTPGTTITAILSTTSVQVNASAIGNGIAVQVFPYGEGDGTTNFNLPDSRGYTYAGVDNTNGTAANVLQVATTLQTNGTTTATPASLVNLAIGMTLTATPTIGGVTITSIGLTNVTLSQAATATVTTATARFSTISDPQTLAAKGGKITHVLAAGELPTVTPTFTGAGINLNQSLVGYGGGQRILNNQTGTTTVAPAGATIIPLVTSFVDPMTITPTGTISSINSNLPLSITQPVQTRYKIIYAGH